ncbi:MAG: DUF11 domain-containing protein, partial [Flavobacteriales bacterium]|nr:DUF11 domain-containing protein [Flavobacteriales bacterium]
MTNLFNNKLILLVILILIAYTSSSACRISAQFGASNNTPIMGETVMFMNTSVGATTYEWQVDGFTVSTNRDYSHYFNGVGVFEVSLIAYGGQRCKSEVKQSFQVIRTPRVLDNRIKELNSLPDRNGQREEIKIYDRFGNDYVWDDIRIPNNTWAAGIFVLHFDDEDIPVQNGSGFDDATAGTFFPTLGQDRREVLIQVFEDISALLVSNSLPSGLPDPYVNLGTTVEIRISTNVYNGNPMPASALGVAGSYYLDYPGMGIGYGAVWKTITTGVDAYYGMATNPMFHGILAINLNHNWYLDLSSSSSITPSQHDLYRVVMHEAMHMLGIASAIDANGTSILANGNYFPYDEFLTSNGVPLITSTSNCYDTQFTGSISNLTGGCSTVQFTGNGINNNNHDLHTPSVWAGGSSLSHFNCVNTVGPCTMSGNGYIMNYCTAAGAVQRIPHISEVETLCDLGYNIQGNYGNGDYTASTTNGSPYQNSCSNTAVAGVNDYSDFVSNMPYTAPIFEVVSDPGNTISIDGSDILGNDFGNPDIISCIEIITPGGNLTSSTVPVTFSDFITYDPINFWSGMAILKYKPYNSVTNTYGNVTYIYINVIGGTPPPCPPNSCNIVCNGDFEIYGCQGCMSGQPIELLAGISDLQLTNGGFGFNTPDIRGSSVTNNLAYIMLAGFSNHQEALFLPLSEPIDVGCTVSISFDAAQAYQDPSRIVIHAANTSPCPLGVNSAGANGSCMATITCPSFSPFCPPMVDMAITNLAPNLGFIPWYDFEPQLQNYSTTWTNNTGVPITEGILIRVQNNPGMTTAGNYIDNIVITKNCVSPVTINSTAVFPNSTPCLGSSVSIDFEVCLPPNVGFNAYPINLAVTFPGAVGFSFGSGGDFNALGEATLPFGALTATNPCTTLTVNLNLLPTAIAGVSLPVELTAGAGNCIVTPGSNALEIFSPGVSNALSITKTVSQGPFYPGDLIMYTITVENTSQTTTVTNIQIQDQLPPNLTSGGQITANLNWNFSTLLSDLFDLGPGQSEILKFRTTINPSMNCGTINNCASIIVADGICNLPITDCVSIFVNS